MINRNSVVGESEDLSLLEILREEEIVIQLTEEEIYNNANCIIKFNENIKQLVEETDIGAKFGSGTEKQLLPLFCEGTKRVNAKLYDFLEIRHPHTHIMSTVGEAGLGWGGQSGN